MAGTAGLETESAAPTLAESQLAAPASLCSGDKDAVQILRSVVRRARRTLPPRTQ